MNPGFSGFRTALSHSVQPIRCGGMVQRMEDVMKTVSRDQMGELGARFLTDTDWGVVDHDTTQGVIELPRGELGRRFTAFARNGFQLIIKGPSSLVIDRAQIPPVEKFIGKDWESIERNAQALALKEVDFSKAIFGCPLREDEKYITGDVKLEREKEEDDKFLRLDSGVGIALHQEPNQVTLRFLHDTFGMTWMEFTGDVLRSPRGGRDFLCLCRFDGGSWFWLCHWLSRAREATRVSVRLAS